MKSGRSGASRGKMGRKQRGGKTHPIIGAERDEGGLDLLALLGSFTAKLLASEKLVVLVVAVFGLIGFVVNGEQVPKEQTAVAESK